MQNRPHFFIIGAARTGTSWLRNTLALHERIFILRPEQRYLYDGPPRKIEARIERAYNVDPQFVGKPAALPSATPGAVLGEKSPLHLIAPIENIRKLGELFPRARIICGVREPISRMLSHLVNRGIDYSKPVRKRRMDKLMRQGRYEQSLRNWASVFHPDQILVHPFERLQRDPRATVAEVCCHIGVGTFSPPTETLPPHKRRQHPGRPPHPQVLEYLQAHCGNDIYTLPALKQAMWEAYQAAHPTPPKAGV